MPEKPIRLGGMLFTLVEPHLGHEVDYNRWYERDHFYAGCMIGAGCFAGGRFVATKECKERRYPATSSFADDTSLGSYLALYWILRGSFGAWIQWGTEQVHRLHADDRMFPHRDHVHTLMYTFADARTPDDDGMPVELALDRCFPGIVAVVGEVAADHTLGEVEAWFGERPVPAEVVAMFTPIPLGDDAPKDVKGDVGEGRFVQLSFVDDDPLGAFDERFATLGDDLAASGLGEVVFASPFLRTVPGTDTYTDQLR